MFGTMETVCVPPIGWKIFSATVEERLCITPIRNLKNSKK